MATKKVAEQYNVKVFSRPAAFAADHPGAQFDEAQDTLLVSSGTFNRPPNPGETVFTSLNAAVSAAIAANRRFQTSLGQNTRFQISGKPCGVADANAARQMTANEQVERVYIQGDTMAPGIHDAIKYANQVPDASAIVVRSEVGPEVPVIGDPLVPAPAAP